MSSVPATADVSQRVREAWERIQADPPADLPVVRPRSPHKTKRRQLAALCHELAGRAWGGVFYLSGGAAGTLLGVNQWVAARWLRDLEEQRLIVCTRKGYTGGGASGYVWVYHGTAAARKRVPARRRPTEKVVARPLLNPEGASVAAN